MADGVTPCGLTDGHNGWHRSVRSIQVRLEGKRRRRATPEGRERDLASGRRSYARRVATPEGRELTREWSRKSQDKRRRLHPDRVYIAHQKYLAKQRIKQITEAFPEIAALMEEETS